MVDNRILYEFATIKKKKNNRQTLNKYKTPNLMK